MHICVYQHHKPNENQGIIERVSKMKKWNEIQGNFDSNECELFQSRLALGKVVVEVGTFHGRSLACIASVAQHVYSVDTFKAHPNGQSQMQYYTTLIDTQESLRGYDNVTFLPGTSDTIAPTFENESIDTVFIDAFHFYEWCMTDCVFWYPKLKIGGIMAVHDSQSYPCTVEVLNKIFGRIDGVVGSVSYVTKNGDEIKTAGQFKL